MPYTTYLRWGVVAGLFAALFIPFVIADGGIMPNMYFPFITGKNFLFRILVEITLALYIILALRDPKYRPRASWIMWTALAFAAWMAIATLLSIDPTKSFWSNFERMEGYVSLLHMMVFFVIAGAVLTAENLWERFFNTSIGASVVMGVYALLQGLELFGLHPSSNSGARADTTFGNATYLAVYMLFNIFLTLYMLARAYSRGRVSTEAQVLYGCALVFQFAGLYLTQTRGALLGAVGGLIIAMIWLALRGESERRSGLRTWSIGGLVALAVLAGGFFLVRDTFRGQGGTLDRLASISLDDPTTRSRFFSIWPMAFAGASERPLIGWGQENFSYVFNEHYNPDMWNQEQWFDRAHNQFLDWLVAGGVPAFLLYISLYLLMAWAIVRSQLAVPEQAAMLGLLAGYAFSSMFVFDNVISSLYFMALLAFAHGLSRQELPGRLWLSRPAGDHVVAVAAPLVVVALAVGSWALNAPGMARATVLVATVNAKDPVAVLQDYKRSLGPVAWPGTSLGYQETTEQFLNYAANSVASSEAPSPVKEDYYATGLAAAQKLMSTRQNDARLELFLSGFYSQFGQAAEAIASAERALALSPQKQQILFQLGFAYVNAGEEAKALDTFKAAYDLAPENDQALMLYAAGEYYNGRAAAGDGLLVSRFGTTTVNDPRLLQIYTQLKMHDRVIAIWKVRVAQNPKDINTSLGLASAYYAAGRIPDAIAQLKKMQQDNPARAAQIQAIIDQLTAVGGGGQ